MKNTIRKTRRGWELWIDTGWHDVEGGSSSFLYMANSFSIYC